MPAPSLWTRFRHTLGRAFRETGQVIDRVALRAIAHANNPKEGLGKIGKDPTYRFNEGHISRHRAQMPLLRRGEPILDLNASFIAPCASLIGYVRVGSGSSIWYGAVLRGDNANMGLGQDDEEWKQMTVEDRDMESFQLDGASAGGGIFIGNDTNVQDGVIITAKKDHTTIGDGVTIGHLAQIHSATIASNSLIGMGAILKPHSTVDSFSLIAAGAVVEEGASIPSGELWVGNPARKLRDLSQEEQKKLSYQSDEYVKVAQSHSHVMTLGGNIADDFEESISMSKKIEKGDPNEVSTNK